MIYLANPTNPTVRAAMLTDPTLGCIVTPAQGNRLPAGVTWCADNGCFGKGYPGDAAWWSWLTAKVATPDAGPCLFAVAPDVVADHEATLERSLPWLPRIRSLGVPAAFVAQDGAQVDTIPWDLFDVLFVGGSTGWKLGRVAESIVRMADDLGYHVHMGRVNTGKRYAYAEHIGCSSVDGTMLTFGPSKNLAELAKWRRRKQLEPSLF